METETPEDIDIGTYCKTRTYKKKLVCLNLYIAICYKDDNKIDYIKIYGGNKGENNCGCSFYNALSDMITFSVRRIRNKHEAEAIIKNLRYHKCNKILPNAEHLTSCVDAIGQVLEKELIKDEVSE